MLCNFQVNIRLFRLLDGLHLGNIICNKPQDIPSFDYKDFCFSNLQKARILVLT